MGQNASIKSVRMLRRITGYIRLPPLFEHSAKTRSHGRGSPHMNAAANMANTVQAATIDNGSQLRLSNPARIRFSNKITETFAEAIVARPRSCEAYRHFEYRSICSSSRLALRFPTPWLTADWVAAELATANVYEGRRPFSFHVGLKAIQGAQMG
jgi:hypothetical protein